MTSDVCIIEGNRLKHAEQVSDGKMVVNGDDDEKK